VIIAEYIMEGRGWSGQDPTGWLMSEKLRGCRAEWSGSALFSKSGNRIATPAWFTRGWPSGYRLSGEIYAGRCEVESASRLAVQYGEFVRGVHTFRIFDMPHAPGNVCERVELATSLIAGASYALPVTFTICEGLDHLIDALRDIQDGGGEGLMLHHPTAPWTAGRTNNLLKVKSLSFALCQAAIQ
jgi:DNA ligase-1